MLHCTKSIVVPLSDSSTPNVSIIENTLKSESFANAVRELMVKVPDHAHGIFVAFHADFYLEDTTVTIDGKEFEVTFRGTFDGRNPTGSIEICYGIGAFE